MEIKTLNEQIERLKELVRKCYGAVAGKNGTVPEVGERNMENLPAAIGSIKEETPEAKEKEVNFYDYKGKRVFSYTASEAMALTELPACPSDEFAEFLKWSEDLETVKMGLPLDVGAYYTCPDGYDLIVQINTKLVNGRNKLFSAKFGVPYVQRKCIIEWGDGSSLEKLLWGTESLTHEYPSAGEYTIKVRNLTHPDTGTITIDNGGIYADSVTAVNGSIRDSMHYKNIKYIAHADNLHYSTFHNNNKYSLGELRHITFPNRAESNITNYLNFPSCTSVIIPTGFVERFSTGYTAMHRFTPSPLVKSLPSDKWYSNPFWFKNGGQLIIPTMCEDFGFCNYTVFTNMSIWVFNPIPPVCPKMQDNTVTIHIPIGSIGDYQLATNLGTATFIEDIPTTINSFSITADDVAADATTTTIHVKANLSMGAMYDDTMVPRDLERDVTSDAFEVNTSSEPRQIEISFTMLGETRTCIITQAGVTA